MSYSLNIWGSGADPEDVKAVFEDTVRALRTVSKGDIGGSLTGTEGTEAFAVQAADVSAFEAESVDSVPDRPVLDPDKD